MSAEPATKTEFRTRYRVERYRSDAAVLGSETEVRVSYCRGYWAGKWLVSIHRRRTAARWTTVGRLGPFDERSDAEESASSLVGALR